MTSQERKYISDAYNQEQGRLLGWIRKRVSNSYDAEDILQDVFFQLTTGFREIQAIENLTAWLYRVAGNKIIDKSRKKKADNFSSLERNGNEEELPLTLAEILPAIQNDPEENELQELIWEELQKSLKEMPGEQAEVFIMHEFEDKSFKEISEITGQSVNTLLSRKRYAVVYLREKLKPLYNLFKS